MIKTLSALRSCFWESHPEFAHHFRTKKRQNQYVCDVRCAWVDFVDSMQKSGEISEKLANRAIL
jgi:hypothetical protein